MRKISHVAVATFERPIVDWLESKPIAKTAKPMRHTAKVENMIVPKKFSFRDSVRKILREFFIPPQAILLFR
jgi:hypothetical protein